jgi:hypothetical protein
MAQHLEALERANVVRYARAELKRAVKAGDVKVAEVLMGDIPDWLGRMRLEELCMCLHRFPIATYHRFTTQAGVGAARLIGELTARQRRALSELLADWEVPAQERQRIRQQEYRERKAA